MHEKNYVYVDYHAHMPETGMRTKWTRHHISQIPELLEKHKNWEQFTTIQTFAAPRKTAGEPHYAPIYFDIDSEGNLEKARQDTLRIIKYFRDIGADQDTIRLYFSGRKGFHITVEPSIFNIDPHPELTYKIKQAAQSVAFELGISTKDDRVYSIPRVWRLPDSKHAGSGLYCVELTHSEIMQPVEVIQEIAKEPRHETFEGRAPFAPAEKGWWLEFERQYENMKDAERLQPKGDIVIPADNSDPPCVKDLMDNGLRKKGTRHSGVLNLVTYFWKKGLNREECTRRVTEWSLRDNTPTTDGSIPSERQKKAGVVSVVNSVYAKDKKDWKFMCKFMLSLGGEAEDCIACAGDDCRFVNVQDREPENRIELPLSKAHDAKYRGIPAKSEIYTMGVSRSPFLIPRRVGFKCIPNLERQNSICQFCSWADKMDDKGRSGGETVISTTDATIIELCSIKKKQANAIILSSMKVPHNCTRAIPYASKETASVNVIEAQADVTEHAENIAEEDINDAHRMYTFYHIGNDILPNKRYMVDYITHPSPDQQLAVHLSNGAKPVESDFERFEMTPEIMSQLKIFQPRGKDVKEKMNEIQRCLEANVHKMWERRELATAVDLVFHSALSFHFQGSPVYRGWLEMCVFGDSGQGKSKIPERLIEFYQRGERVSCEQASEAGLVGGCDTGSNMVRWGAIPRNDKGFLLLDEVHSLHEDILGNLSDIRDKGVAQIHKFSHGKAMARNRKIFTANPRYKNSTMRSSPYGIMVLQNIFQASEDIRRLDLGIAITNRDVNKEILNQKKVPVVDNMYDQASCGLLLDWIWSRRMDQIKIPEEVEHHILDKAIEMCSVFDETIPLVHGSVQKESIARLAVACAGRMFSCDETGSFLVVQKEHVDFVVDFMTKHYKSRAMGYYEYSMEARKYTEWGEDEFDACIHELKSNVNNLKSLLTAISHRQVFKPTEIELEWDGSSRFDIKVVMSIFNKYKLIQPSSSQGHFKRSEKFADVYEVLKEVKGGMPDLTADEVLRML